jgi:SAM-dependent methyltransferase
MRSLPPAALRNREPIADVLAEILPATGLVLEVASGSGVHAVHFARRFPGLTWQPSDIDPAALDSIAAYTAEVAAREGALPGNLAAPIYLDAAAEPWPVSRADVVLSLNMVHISPWAACLGLLRGAGQVLRPGGLLIVYGPYRVRGQATAPSNEMFDRSLRAQDPAWGLRVLDDVAEAAAPHGLTLAQTFDMPANNLTVVFRKA